MADQGKVPRRTVGGARKKTQLKKRGSPATKKKSLRAKRMDQHQEEKKSVEKDPATEKGGGGRQGGFFGHCGRGGRHIQLSLGEKRGGGGRGEKGEGKRYFFRREWSTRPEKDKILSFSSKKRERKTKKHKGRSLNPVGQGGHSRNFDNYAREGGKKKTGYGFGGRFSEQARAQGQVPSVTTKWPKAETVKETQQQKGKERTTVFPRIRSVKQGT